jgi:hypothetical protein
VYISRKPTRALLACPRKVHHPGARQAAALFLIAPMIAVSMAPPAAPAITCEMMPSTLRLPYGGDRFLCASARGLPAALQALNDQVVERQSNHLLEPQEGGSGIGV